MAALVVLGLAEVVPATLALNGGGMFGLTFVQSGSIGSLTVQAVAPGSPAEKAHIRAGDRVSIAATRENMLVSLVTESGDREIVRDGARTIELRAAAANGPPLALTVISYPARLAFVIIAAIVAWRRPDDPAARALSVFLACFGVAISSNLALFHPFWARMLTIALVQALFFVGTLAALAFACRFPSLPQHGLRRELDRWLWLVALIGIVLGDSPLLIRYANPAATQNVRALLPLPFLILYAAVIVATLVAFWNSYRWATGRERVRVRWVLITFAFGFSGIIIYFASILAQRGMPYLQFASFTMLAIPFGLAYAILRHRMLDIGFVVNRALVYAGVSLIVVASFTIFEWLAGNVVAQNSRASVIIQLCAALVLGLFVRPLQARVERWVDDVFFRERHAAETAVRKFAHEALLVTSPDELVAKTVDVAQRHMHLAGCAFYARRDDRYAPLRSTFEESPEIDENDYAVLEMRTWHTSVDVAHAKSALPGDLALPMIVRGTLAGFLLCGEKQSHEAFAPDERDALALLARDAGIALDSLRIRAIERDLTLLARNDDVPAEVRARLEALATDGATGGGRVAL